MHGNKYDYDAERAAALMKENTLDDICSLCGSKYNKTYGPYVLKWFAETALNGSNDEWRSRYGLYSREFSRYVPQTTLNRILDRMIDDNVLELKMVSGNYNIRFNEDYMGVMLSHIKMVGR